MLNYTLFAYGITNSVRFNIISKNSDDHYKRVVCPKC